MKLMSPEGEDGPAIYQHSKMENTVLTTISTISNYAVILHSIQREESHISTSSETGPIILLRAQLRRPFSVRNLHRNVVHDDENGRVPHGLECCGRQ